MVVYLFGKARAATVFFLGEYMTNKTKKAWCVYLLECVNGKIYTGITTDMEKRFKAHVLGKGAMFTRRNPPLHILAVRQCDNRSDASRLEYQIKRLTPTQKRTLVNDWEADTTSD